MPARDFYDQMEEALEVSDFVVPIFTEDYFQSEKAVAECRARWFEERVVIPVVAARCRIPRLFRSRVAIDLTDSDDDDSRKRLLLDELRAAVSGTRRPTHRMPVRVLADLSHARPDRKLEGARVARLGCVLLTAFQVLAWTFAESAGSLPRGGTELALSAEPAWMDVVGVTLSLKTGTPLGSDTEFEDLIERGLRHGSVREVAVALYYRGLREAADGRHEDARDYLERAAEEMEGSDRLPDLMLAWCCTAEIVRLSVDLPEPVASGTDRLEDLRRRFWELRDRARKAQVEFSCGGLRPG